ncbi:uncharacterized protein H6S33_000699 [Morchella sextelata]|uniref:uncharacterized protein n=1 Tax=Morchella sextelata TaxID=1174677 RepID=UPI001D04A7E6|nr:uncharacterized protein H6S33_000699 [Morchella sextelata]KAH0615063.1 hypothetical protein H6S33_000699 [Morchella sextelata]
MEPGGNHQTGAAAEMSNTASSTASSTRSLPAETENTTATATTTTAPSSSNTPATAASSAEPHANNTPKSLDAETTTDKVQVSSTTASGTDDDEWVWSNGTVGNTPAADRDELRYSDTGSGDCGGQVEAAAAAEAEEHEEVVDALESSCSVNDVAANLSGSTNNSTPVLLPTTKTSTTTTTTTTIEKTSPEQHLLEIPMESNSSTTDYKLDNNDLLSSDTDINQVSTPVLGSATDRTLNMLSTQVAGLSMSPANPDSAPSDISNSLAPVPDKPELNEISPPTPRKDDNNNTITSSSSRSPISPALLQTLPLPQPPPAPPPKDVPPKDRVYLDPAPLTPGRSRSVSPTRDSSDRELPRNPRSGSSSEDDEPGDNTRSEIHNIFEQSNEKSSTSLASSGSQPPIMHPIRSSSLSNESGKPGDTTSPGQASQQIPQLALTPTPNVAGKAREEAVQSPIVSQQQPPPPPPDEDLPFDFHRFLRQLRKGSADPVAKFLSSFLREFAKKQWMVHEQVKIVHDFLNFIYGKMESCDVWRDVGEVEMDNAREGMEKLVMNRLYTQTFSPEILQASPPSAGGSRRTPSDDMFPGRRGQHQEDVERDEVLAQKVRIYGWIREEHLDIGDTIKNYRAPRDKVICVLNCCKVIFGLLRHSNSDESADKFIPLLIYVVLRANPEHLVSNVQYILRFRNPDKLNGEAGYYLSSLMGAIQFIENLDRSSLTITDEEFEKNVEAAVAAIAERPPPPSPPQLPPRRQSSYNTETVSEKGRRSTEGRSSTSSNDSSSGESDEKAAVAGLLRTIQRPLTTIGRIFSDGEPSNATLSVSSNSGPALTPRGRSPSAEDSLLTAVGGRGHSGRRRPPVTAEEAAARQASAETEEARRIQRSEHENVVDILKAMFPALDKEIIGDVVSMKEGRVGEAVDACLALSG